MSEYPRISARAARVNAGMTLEQASKEIGVNRGTLIKYEKGETVPDWDVAEKMGNVYGFPTQFIYFGRKSVLNGERGV